MIKLADLFLQFYSIVLLARVIISFIKIDPKQPAVKFLTKITDPALDPIRKFIPPAGGFAFCNIGFSNYSVSAGYFAVLILTFCKTY